MLLSVGKSQCFGSTLRCNARWLGTSFAFPPSRATRSGSDKERSGRIDLTSDLRKSARANSRNNPSKNVDPRLVKQFANESIYDPFDFSLERIRLDRKFRSTEKPLGPVNPMNLYSSPEMLVRYVSSSGKILHSDVTGLAHKDQKRLAKAIRRCQAIGLMSKTSNAYNK
ncbi:mitochondrial 37S ribosomal protein bS18m RSM18 KNAG_0L01360 [Huiozyma naganishii CBS 8797]|uniref:Small ribosomal subunit protein bS18m n=1 Tax=Huiozyma naganishii (strain ATCC MYA-139 / BCRC 22969 / CBS 8797 / KCTC 17520 / NBRC 10181 / NCYC 3082 / Yp74L-3) TaxID=1071383 RepID=J7SB54_HUIN7|nr:hypothetical protein KNAG_0L01360 [Kazachstania naganishii CBS 8797]CCK72756.1 hypothetical protein KNAG_0L01360 [Kazachstania naganishii CBS 8797]